MMLSTKGRYGLRMMFELALHYDKGEPLSIKEIANNQNLSDAYLEQLIATMKKAKLVKSTRGKQGGYLLAKPPVEITAGEIIRLLEGPIGCSPCTAGDETEIKEAASHCANSDICVTRLLWQRVTDSINEVLDTTTLGDMIQDYCGLKSPMNKRD